MRRLLSRPSPGDLRMIRYGLGLTDEPPVELEGPFAPLARRRLHPGQGSPAVLARTTKVLGEVREVLASLDGIPVMLLKGLPMALFVYREMDVRRMADADLLVRPDRFAEACEVLRSRGFGLRLEAPRALPTAPAHVDHSLAFRRPGGVEIDLHYFALDECRWEGADEGFWQRSRERVLFGTPVRVPGRTDMLLHVLAHGYRTQRHAPRWVCDAGALMLDEAERIDWTLLVEETRRRRLVLPVRTCLRCLEEDLGLAVPAEALAALGRSPVAAWEPFDFWLRAATPLDGRVRRLFLAVLDYLRFTRQPTLAGLLEYLRKRWGVEGSLWEEVARRARNVLQGVPARGPGGG